MKRMVIARDGMEAGCHWCKRPFTESDPATLEHIFPLADGGPHVLENCALAHMSCNLKNIPKIVLSIQEEAEARREHNAKINNSGPRTFQSGEIDCPVFVQNRFKALFRTTYGKRFRDMGYATEILRNIHRQNGSLPPSKEQIRIFKGHYNRWITQLEQERAALLKRTLDTQRVA